MKLLAVDMIHFERYRHRGLSRRNIANRILNKIVRFIKQVFSN